MARLRDSSFPGTRIFKPEEPLPGDPSRNGAYTGTAKVRVIPPGVFGEDLVRLGLAAKNEKRAARVAQTAHSRRRGGRKVAGQPSAPPAPPETPPLAPEGPPLVPAAELRQPLTPVPARAPERSQRRSAPTRRAGAKPAAPPPLSEG